MKTIAPSIQPLRSSTGFFAWRKCAHIILLTMSLAIAMAADNAQDSLARALHLANLYNWVAAAPDFAKAERLFSDAGDHRNALYARLGTIRANAELEQKSMLATSLQLSDLLASNSILQTDKQLRLFCWIVKGDLDTAINTGAMRRDWEEVQTLAKELGNQQWQYRARAQLGVAAFYEGDLETARTNVASALADATAANDVASQIRILTMLGNALNESKDFQQAIRYFDRAQTLSATIPEAGYSFTLHQVRFVALVGLKQFAAADSLARDFLVRAQLERRRWAEVTGLELMARLHLVRGDAKSATDCLVRAAALAESLGLIPLLATAQAMLSDVYREAGDLAGAERFAELAAASTQASGIVWAVPDRLQALAKVQVARGKFRDADRVYGRAGAFIDSMIGNVTSVLEKTALIRASSELYAQHFSLVAEHFQNPAQAYAIIEQVRGRISADLFAAGSFRPEQAERVEQAIARLRIKLMSARSDTDVRRLGDEVFLAEQSRWVTPSLSILRNKSREPVSLTQLQRSLAPSAIVLEYVVASPRSYCLAISQAGAHIIPLPGKEQIEKLVTAYLKAVRERKPASTEARSLYDALLQPIPEAIKMEHLLVIRDGPLHLVPFDAFMAPSGQYVLETKTVGYAPSATSFYLLTHRTSDRAFAPRPLLAVGGVPYGSGEGGQFSLSRGYVSGKLADLPSSKEEVLAASAALGDQRNVVLTGEKTTESAFKRTALDQYRTIHLAVHGVANKTYPERSALILLKDAKAGEDGILQASEVVQLRLDAELVVLSACETAVGTLQGQEGISALSGAFLLAGARRVVSTLWAIDDSASLSLMKRFYKHFPEHNSAATALRAAKREMLAELGSNAIPYYWAGFTFEGVAEGVLHKARGK